MFVFVSPNMATPLSYMCTSAAALLQTSAGREGVCEADEEVQMTRSATKTIERRRRACDITCITCTHTHTHFAMLANHSLYISLCPSPTARIHMHARTVRTQLNRPQDESTKDPVGA